MVNLQPKAAACSVATSALGQMERKVGTTQSAILPNRKVLCKQEQQVPQKITADAGFSGRQG